MSNIASSSPTSSPTSSPVMPNSNGQGQVPPSSPQNPPSDKQTLKRVDPTKNKIKWNYIIGGIVLLLLVIGGGAGYWLTQQNQDIRQQASTGDYPTPPPTCTEECPGADGILRNCTPPEADGSPEESICNAAGRVESCGGVEYCCPTVDGAWTTNMTACTASPSPSASPSASPSPSPTPSPSPSPSVSPSPTPTTEPSPTPTDNPSPTPTDNPTFECNSNCISNSQCQSANANYICFQGKCRSDSNPISDQCAQTAKTQPKLPAELPQSGSEDVLNWLKAGLGVLGLGTVLLLLL